MVTILGVFVTKLWLESRRTGEEKQNVGANDTKKSNLLGITFVAEKI